MAAECLFWPDRFVSMTVGLVLNPDDNETILYMTVGPECWETHKLNIPAPKGPFPLKRWHCYMKIRSEARFRRVHVTS